MKMKTENANAYRMHNFAPFSTVSQQLGTSKGLSEDGCMLYHTTKESDHMSEEGHVCCTKSYNRRPMHTKVSLFLLKLYLVSINT